MNIKRQAWAWAMGGALWALAAAPSWAALPEDFPAFTVTTLDTNRVAEGYVFLTSSVGAGGPSQPTGGGYTYLLILHNDGTPVWYQKITPGTPTDFEVLPNGYLGYGQALPSAWMGGADVQFKILDDNFNETEVITGGNGYVPELHDFEVLPNGHVLFLSFYLQKVDMSQFVPGGHPGAFLKGVCVIELDGNRNVVWQWRLWDHLSIADYPFTPQEARQAVIQPLFLIHANNLNLDADGNILLSTPADLMKINRQSGEIMWILGGPFNQFTLANPPAADLTHFTSHGAHRLANGNFILYDNAAMPGTPGALSSQVHEYALDEVNKIAAQRWTWAPATNVPGTHMGYAQRLPNGNTFISWGNSLIGAPIPACTEITPAGEVVYELWFAPTPRTFSYRAFRYPYPPSAQASVHQEVELAAGNEYDFGRTGVILDVQSGGGGYNEVTVTREPYAPIAPLFAGKPPRVLPVRVKAEEYLIDSFTAELAFDVDRFGFVDPGALKIYHRQTPGQGFFVPLPTSYNPAQRKVRTTMSRFGEFIFGYADVADVAAPPILNQVENDRGPQLSMVIAPPMAETGAVYAVNQQLPIHLSWSPRGFARWYELEIATEATFSNPVVDISYLTAGYFNWSNAAPDTTYFYRVKTWTFNQAGLGEASDWATGAFQTVAPRIEVLAPNGGEVWLNGLDYFIRWEDNLAEDVIIELYQGGVRLTNIATTASTGAYQWEVNLELAPGYDYAIRVRSATNAALADLSDQPFANTRPSLAADSLTRLPDGRIQFALNAPGAEQATVLISTNLLDWAPRQTLPLINGAAVFTEEALPDAAGQAYYRLRVP